MENPSCLILGASSGMGEACAQEFHSRGFRVFGVFLGSSTIQEKVDLFVSEMNEKRPNSAFFFNENAADENAIKRIIQVIKNEIPDNCGINVLVHSLAFGALLPFISESSKILTKRQLEMTMNVMANSLPIWTQELMKNKLMKNGDHIFGLTSAGSSRVVPGYGAVSAAKAALEAYIRQLAFELAPYGIAVNAIRAGVTITQSLEKIPGYLELVEKATQYNPHGRLTTPQDIAKSIYHISQDRRSWITGNVIGADGGENLR